MYKRQVLILSSCSYISGPEGFFPTTKYDFLSESVEKEIILPENLNLESVENHYPVVALQERISEQDVPRPRQIFASSGDSSVQLRRLGQLLWIYIETLPSTSWPISKSYWDTSSYEVLNSNPDTGVIEIDFDESSILQMKIEHGIKEASTEIFLNKINKSNSEMVADSEFIQAELEKIVNYFAESINTFTGTSLAAQNLNEMKKAKIFTENGQTVIELDLNFDRAWSSVTKAMTAANIVANDKDRSNGIFYVSYSKEEDEGFFSFLGFGQEKRGSENLFNKEAQFEVKISEKNNKTYVLAKSNNDKIDYSEELLSKNKDS